ncbi:MAG TPA: hypothetical protein VJ302_23330 [Blastocatellia bacterium]|nr:hypothetical protein [Blastocatellia bacterium]
MITKPPTTPEDILALLKDVSRDVYSGLIDGCMKAREYFDDLSYPLNRSLAANIARYHTKQYIATRRSIGVPYFLKDVPNNGIAIRQEVFDIKVLKGLDGDPPSPSKSKRSVDFYNQVPPGRPVLFPGMFHPWTSAEWPQFIASKDMLDLILFWEVDDSYSLIKLQLTCPLRAWKYGQTVRVFWKRPIDNPFDGTARRGDLNQNDPDDEDLDIAIDSEFESDN